MNSATVLPHASDAPLPTQPPAPTAAPPRRPAPRIELSFDGRRDAAGPGEEALLMVPLGPALGAMEHLANEPRGTRLGVAAALFLVLLYRHTQQAVLELGVVERSSSNELVCAGILRTPLSDELHFLDLLSLTQAQVAALRCNVQADGAQPLGNLVFGWDDAPTRADLACFGDGIELLATLCTIDDRPMLCLRYDSRIFAAAPMREFAGQFATLLRQALEAPALPILQYSLVTEDSRPLLPDPRRALDTPRHPPIAELILDWAARTPEAPAIRQHGRAFSYAELAECSKRVAFELRARGVAAGEVVAVTGERGFALVSAMLGVFRSGAVLLTLDPNLPAERRQAMIDQANARALVQVHREGQADTAAARAPVTVLIDAQSHRIVGSRECNDAALPDVDPTQAAYVFFTSGSTGVPKGVKGRHAGLSHFLNWQRETFGMGPGDRASQLTALSFDVVLRDTFLALTSGATLCIPDSADVLDPVRIFEWLEREQITTIHVVPSLARMWLNHVPAGAALPELRRIFFAGEPLMGVLVQRWREAFPGAYEIINLYGPTETTLAKCFYRVPVPPAAGIQPIGQTLPQTQALILNSRRQLCGLHEAGEIAIRTPFRTLGYIDNPQANAKAFVQNPFGSDPDDLVYLTGDSGRYRTDGLLEILGRIDNQVKIRGVRIEPGEIEAALGRHADVREAAVVARDDGLGDKMLVAYVVPKSGGAGPDSWMRIAAYRQYLRDRLPDAMVPSAFVLLDALPLNANGKLDKKTLPAPDRAALAANRYVEPQSDFQKELARVWRAVLKLDQVGIDDNFFDIGGHSLLAVQLARAVERALHRSCPLPLLFRAPTIRTLGAALERGDAADGAAVLPLQALGAGPALFCICGIQLYQALADQLAPEVPVCGIFLPSEQALFDSGATSSSAFPSLERMATEYVDAMRVQQPNGPYRLAGVSFGGVLAYEMAQQLLRAGERVELLGILDSMLPSALRRDWAVWALEHLRQIRAHGWRAFGKRVLRRLGRSRNAAKPTPGTLVSTDPVDDDVDRLAALRQALYAQATRAYVPRTYPASAILIRAEDKSFFKSDIADASYGWSALVAQLQVVDVPGDHLGILKAPNVQIVARAFRRHLEGTGSLAQDHTARMHETSNAG